MVSEPYAYHQPPAPPPPPPPVPVAPPPVAATAPLKVALLVPLSGANAALGHGILDAAQMALFRTGGERLTLLPRDTGGNAAGAAKGARAAVADGARLILGPLLATEVAAVKPIAAEAHVNVIAFSTVTRLAGGNVYLMGFLPRQEVVREVGYAREKGLDSFAALAPDSPYGHLMADALREVASSSGGAVTDIEFYDPRGDAKAAIVHLLPPAPAADMPHFAALMVPEGGARLQVLGRELQAAGLDKSRVRLLGSGLWDEPDIGREPALDGGWFAAPSPDTRQDFERRFAATYGHPPPRLASLGYDAAALAAVLARQEGGDPFSRMALENPSGFTGVDGLFRFAPDGLVERGLAMLEVRPQGNIVISPAPDSFRNLGY
jgi:branched-chain amino acid transport system substrate-binding protein